MCNHFDKFLLTFALFFVLCLPAFPAHAQEEGGAVAKKGSVTHLPIPRLVSLRSDKVYVRSGPGMRYPIKWIYRKRDYPVQVNREFGTWRRISDIDGSEGWVHQSLLSSRRFAIINVDKNGAFLYRKPDEKSVKRARIESGVIVRFSDQETLCEDGWCAVATAGFKGWVEENSLWGVDVHNESDNSE